MRLAILDFGTNTFNLLIAENTEDKKVKFLYSSKEPVKLGEGGINDKILHDDAIERALKAIAKHYLSIRSFKADKIYAFATSAIRDAKNSKLFLKRVQEIFDLYVHIIPGEREAELIYKGVRLACNFSEEKNLITDIGGGSIEFIIADRQKTYWIESYDLGMARMLERFKPEDPISQNTVENLKNYFSEQLSPVFEAVEKFKPTALVGASGSYETFYEIIKRQLPKKYSNNGRPGKEIILEDFRGLHQNLLLSTIEERKNMPGMEPVRVEMIV
ncbi:MAG: phosphatase, partial [Bacteroidota bacterium]